MRKESNAGEGEIDYPGLVNSPLDKVEMAAWSQVLGLIEKNMMANKSFYVTIGRNKDGTAILIKSEIQGYKPLYSSYSGVMDRAEALAKLVRDLKED